MLRRGYDGLSFWPKKARKIPGESELSTWDYSLAFPGCFASGLASKVRRGRIKIAASMGV